MMGMVLLCGSIIYAIVLVGMCFIRRFDNLQWDLRESEDLLLFAGSGSLGAVISCLSESNSMNTQGAVFLSCFAGCLLFASVTDNKTCRVYQFTWWVAGAMSVLLLYQRFTKELPGTWSLGLWIAHRLIPLLLYVLLQELFFCKFYGKADCHAFAVCAVAECALGMDMPEYLMHMILAFGFLTAVQFFRGNIGRRGHLKHKVAFLPYITAGFWANFCCFSLQNMVY